MGFLLYRAETVMAERIETAEKTCHSVLKDIRLEKDKDKVVETFFKLFQSYKNTFLFYNASFSRRVTL